MFKAKKLTIGLISAAILSFVAVGLASAQSKTITAEHVSRIRANCVTAKSTIAQLHANDALTRVNYGQLYESLTTRLMSRFNTRVDNNGYSAKSLTAVDRFYNQVLEGFRQAYQEYADELELVLDIDCVRDPVKFYNAVLEARDKRSQVSSYIKRLNQNLSEYKSAFNAFVISFEDKERR